MSGKRPFEDDGRTIVDMSGVERPNLFPFRKVREEPKLPEEERERNRESWERNGELDTKERLWLIFGSLRAALLIVLIFGVCFALVILAFLHFYL